MKWLIHEVSQITGLTPRTIRHYEQVGLLTPARHENDYRVYSMREITRLQEILFYRESGMQLIEIKEMLETPGHDTVQVLVSVKSRLVERRDQIDRMLGNLDKAIHRQRTKQEEIMQDPKDMFDGFDPTSVEEETSRRWGDTPEYQQSIHRTSSYEEQDWRLIEEEQTGLYEALYALMQQGASVSDDAVQKLVEAHRAFISRWFYDCSDERHRSLALMYEQDERFVRTIEAKGTRPRLAQFLSQAILLEHGNPDGAP